MQLPQRLDPALPQLIIHRGKPVSFGFNHPEVLCNFDTQSLALVRKISEKYHYGVSLPATFILERATYGPDGF